MLRGNMAIARPVVCNATSRLGAEQMGRGRGCQGAASSDAAQPPKAG